MIKYTFILCKGDKRKWADELLNDLYNLHYDAQESIEKEFKDELELVKNNPQKLSYKQYINLFNEILNKQYYYTIVMYCESKECLVCCGFETAEYRAYCDALDNAQSAYKLAKHLELDF